MDPLDRHRGCLLGLSAGDALGTTNEFSSPGTFPPLTTIVGGGPFKLRPGEWTDDTSMALCLAESLRKTGRFDARDQMDRYLRWRREGYMSVTGRCFDIGATVGAALDRYERSGDPFSGDPSPWTAGNGSLMRLAPVVLFFHKDPEKAIHYAGESSRTTHAAPQALACCRQWARLILMALDGRSKDEIVAAPCPEADPVVRAAATGCQAKPRLAIEGAGYVVKSLEAALWCFAQTASFDEGCLTAANLGDDADTVAAIYGQLAGAYYGEPGIPDSWLRVLAWSDRIRAMAEDLLRQGSEGR